MFEKRILDFKKYLFSYFQSFVLLYKQILQYLYVYGYKLQ